MAYIQRHFMTFCTALVLVASVGCDATPKTAPAPSTEPTIQPHAEESSINPDEEYEEGSNFVLRKDFKNAIKHLTLAIDHWGDRPGIHHLHYERGVAYECNEDYDKSIEDLTKAIEINPSVYALFSRAKAYCGKYDYSRALRDYSDAVEMRPNDFRSLNAAAWLLACSPIDTDRNGTRALELATRACEETSYEDYICVDTLACAYANIGEFQKAVEWETEARDLYVAQEEVHDGPGAIEFTFELVKYEEKLKLFREATPFRELARRPVK
jgi:tetratricopeptide (TPR) repeat protein